MKVWTDYTDAIIKGIKLLPKVFKIPDQLEKAGDLVGGGPDPGL